MKKRLVVPVAGLVITILAFGGTTAKAQHGFSSSARRYQYRNFGRIAPDPSFHRPSTGAGYSGYSNNNSNYNYSSNGYYRNNNSGYVYRNVAPSSRTAASGTVPSGTGIVSSGTAASGAGVVSSGTAGFRGSAGNVIPKASNPASNSSNPAAPNSSNTVQVAPPKTSNVWIWR